jgi:hypothetical protein
MKIEEEISQPKFRNAMQRAIINVIFTSHWIVDRYQNFFKPYGITLQQFNILRILKGQYPNGISGTTIKARMMDKNSDVSRLLDRLELKNLKKDPVRKTSVRPIYSYHKAAWICWPNSIPDRKSSMLYSHFQMKMLPC